MFGKRRKRTIEAIIKSIYETESLRVTNKSLNKDDFFKSELLRIGQVNMRKLLFSNFEIFYLKIYYSTLSKNLKLQTVIKGDAPTSQITTAVTKKEV